MNQFRVVRLRVEASCLALWLFSAGFGFAASRNDSSLSPGLVTTAADGDRSVSWISRTPNFTLLVAESIHPQVKPVFKAEWNGFLKIVRAGRYTIFSEGTTVLDGREVQNQPLSLTAGEHELRISYHRSAGKPARLQLEWEAEYFKREPVPAGVLAHRDAPEAVRQSAKLDRGRELVNELGCASCHRSTSGFLKPRLGAGFASIGQLDRGWLAQSGAIERHFDGRAEFRLLMAGADQVTTAADTIGMVATTAGGGSAAEDSKTPAGSSGKGKELFQGVGCAGCHNDTKFPLTDVPRKWPKNALIAYLENPIKFNSSGRMPDLSLRPGEAADLAEFLGSITSSSAKSEARPIVNSEDGRRALEVSGCVNCHAGALGGTKLVNRLAAPTLERIRLDRECLAGNQPRFTISKEDWSAIRGFLGSPDLAAAPVQEFEWLVKQLNCSACHELNGPAILSFEVNQGPPPLSDAGNKLRASWLNQVLLQKKRIRPWMALRMPHFGESVRPLVNDFAAQAGAELGEGEALPPPDAGQIQRGIKLLGRGEGGLSCISCHDFHGEKPPGDIRGPEMTEMSARIRADWMRRWLRDPARIQPGTAMPSFFGDFATAQGEETIGTIIRTLTGGINLPMPEGMSDAGKQYLLLVKNEPVVLRTFIPDSSPRSIAVGIPGAQNYVFDAENCRFRYAWSGDFLDVKPVWSDRGGGKARILGPRYYTAPEGQQIQIGNAGPEPRVKFLGYQLIDGLPEFRYELNDVLVREYIRSSPAGNGLIRHFEIEPRGREVWLVLTESSGVQIACSAGRIENGRAKVSSGENARFDVTVTRVR